MANVFPPSTYQSPACHPLNLKATGPLIRLNVMPCATDISPDNPLRSEPVIALIDTGASVTSISLRLAERLELNSIDNIDCTGAHGVPVSCEVYAVDVHPLESKFTIRNLRVASCDLHSAFYDVLVGRDILEIAYFTYDGALASFSLTIPSLNHPLCEVPPPPVAAAKLPTSKPRNAKSPKAIQKASRQRNRPK